MNPAMSETYRDTLDQLAGFGVVFREAQARDDYALSAPRSIRAWATRWGWTRYRAAQLLKALSPPPEEAPEETPKHDFQPAVRQNQPGAGQKTRKTTPQRALFSQPPDTFSQPSDKNTIRKESSPPAPPLKETSPSPPKRSLTGSKRSPSSSSKKFTPPTLDEAVAYFAELGETAEMAAHFIDHYNSNGWRVGGKAPMKDWQSAARNWKRNDHRFSGNGKRKPEPTGTLEELYAANLAVLAGPS